jgi:hypothetical protein
MIPTNPGNLTVLAISLEWISTLLLDGGNDHFWLPMQHDAFPCKRLFSTLSIDSSSASEHASET